MRIFADRSKYTHHAHFYGIHCYLRFDEADDMPVLEGVTWFHDQGVKIATLFHNYWVEVSAQVLAYITDAPYEPGFPMFVRPFNDPENTV